MTTCLPHSLPLSGWGPSAMHRGVGALGEDLAAHHLRVRDRLVIVDRNWRPDDAQVRGEIDIVAADETTRTLVICEVKTRRDAQRFGGAISALAATQRQRLRGLAAIAARRAPFPVDTVRCDLVAIDLGHRPTLTHVIDAW